MCTALTHTRQQPPDTPGHEPGETFMVKQSCPLESRDTGESASSPEKKSGRGTQQRGVAGELHSSLCEQMDRFQVDREWARESEPQEFEGLD